MTVGSDETLWSERSVRASRFATLTVPAAQIDALARLGDDPSTLSVLQSARLSRNLAFLGSIVRSIADDPAGRMARAGFELLVEVQRENPEVVRDTLQHPRFGGWAAVCAAMPEGLGVSDSRVAHLAVFAASAAIRIGKAFDLEVPQLGDAVVVPGLGCWAGTTGDSIRLRFEGGAVLPDAGHDWTPLRRLVARVPDGVLEIEFDDLPMTPAAWPDLVPADRELRWQPRPDVEFVRWQQVFESAVELLWETVPELAGPLSRGMRAVIPRAADSSAFVSSTLADAFGAAAMVLPTDALAGATALVHEFQHSKLCALMEVMPLVAVDGPADLPSPWRKELRPASGVLHGIYAHLAVARLQSRVRPRAGRPIGDDLVREQTLAACKTLLQSDRLTATGRRFVQLMRHTAIHDGRAAASNL